MPDKKQIAVSDVTGIEVVSKTQYDQKILLKTKDGDYIALGDIERIENTYYCHYGYECWNN